MEESSAGMIVGRGRRTFSGPERGARGVCPRKGVNGARKKPSSGVNPASRLQCHCRRITLQEGVVDRPRLVARAVFGVAGGLGAIVDRDAVAGAVNRGGAGLA